MVQQINLLTPILLKPRRYFSALAMVQALGLLLLAGAALALWLNLQAREDQQAAADAKARAAAEQQRLVQALASLPAAVDGAQMARQLRQLEQDNAQQQLTLDLLTSGVAPEGSRHSDVLRLLAQSVPPAIWLGELRWQAGRLVLSGATLEPAALQRWLQTLARNPLFAGLRLGDVQVEQWSAAGMPADSAGPLPAGLRTPVLPAQRPGQPIWSFRAVSERPAPVIPASGAAP